MRQRWVFVLILTLSTAWTSLAHADHHTDAVDGFTFLIHEWGSLYKTYQKEAPSYFSIDIVLLGDGFTEAEAETFDKAATELMDNLWKIVPFDEYQCAFNVYFVLPLSTTSGLSDPPLKTTFGSSSSGFGFVKADLTKCEQACTAVGIGDPDVMVVIANSDKYGSWYSGNLITMSGAGVFPATLGHELGHVLAVLGDEYDFYYGDSRDIGRTYESESDPGYPNVSQYGTMTDVAKIPWLSEIPSWVIDSKFIPMTNMESCVCGTIGAWEGAGTYPNLYRPAEYCLMRRVCDVTPFCQVCRDALIARLHSPFLLFGCDAKLMVATSDTEDTIFSLIKEPPDMAPEIIPPEREFELRLPADRPAMVVVNIPPCYACLPIPVPGPPEDAAEPIRVRIEMPATDWTMWVMDETGAVVAGPTHERATAQELNFNGSTSHQYRVMLYIEESRTRALELKLDMLRNSISVLR